MPPPTQPSLTLSAVSTTSFQAVVSGADAGDTVTLYYRQVGATQDTQGPSQTGNGTLTVTGLVDSGQYQAFVVASNGTSFSLPAYGYVSLGTSDLLSAAVHAQFNQNGALVQAIPGGMWTGEVPEGTNPPYVWLDLPDTQTTPIFVDYFERSFFHAHLYAIGAQQAEAAAAAFKAVFDWCSLPFQTAGSVWCQPRRKRLIPEKARWKDGTLMYRVVLTYDVLAQYPRP